MTAVLIPCLNEVAAIPKVIADFRAQLSDATIFVYDNGSSDGTVEAARATGAIVRIEPLLRHALVVVIALFYLGSQQAKVLQFIYFQF